MKGISMSAMSVQAIIDDRKTNSRRIALPQPVYSEDMGKWVFYPKGHPTVYADLIKLPEYSRYKPGETLYVKETYYQRGSWIKNGKTKTGRQQWKFVPADDVVRYKNTEPANFEVSKHKEHPGETWWYKRNARFMPASAARLFIKIKSVRVEKVSQTPPTKARGLVSKLHLNSAYLLRRSALASLSDTLGVLTKTPVRI